jgi:predicted helicase
MLDRTPTSGPGATFTAEVPDAHHYKGSFWGRVFPLWLDPAGTVPNVVPGLLEHLAERYGGTVTAEDLFAYLAVVLSHPGYTSTFAADLAVPGLRVSLTASPQAFRRAVAIGKRVL